MELTREEIEELASYNSATEGQTMYMDEFVARIAKQLLAEMDKPKVWEGAPEWATEARVRWTDRNGVSGHNDMYSPLYTRTLPKSRIDEIAEEAQSSFLDGTNKPLTEVIKSAILKDREERH